MLSPADQPLDPLVSFDGGYQAGGSGLTGARSVDRLSVHDGHAVTTSPRPGVSRVVSSSSSHSLSLTPSHRHGSMRGFAPFDRLAVGTPPPPAPPPAPPLLPPSALLTASQPSPLPSPRWSHSDLPPLRVEGRQGGGPLGEYMGRSSITLREQEIGTPIRSSLGQQQQHHHQQQQHAYQPFHQYQQVQHQARSSAGWPSPYSLQWQRRRQSGFSGDAPLYSVDEGEQGEGMSSREQQQQQQQQRVGPDISQPGAATSLRLSGPIDRLPLLPLPLIQPATQGSSTVDVSVPLSRPPSAYSHAGEHVRGALSSSTFASAASGRLRPVRTSSFAPQLPRNLPRWDRSSSPGADLPWLHGAGGEGSGEGSVGPSVSFGAEGGAAAMYRQLLQQQQQEMRSSLMRAGARGAEEGFRATTPGVEGLGLERRGGEGGLYSAQGYSRLRGGEEGMTPRISLVENRAVGGSNWLSSPTRQVMSMPALGTAGAGSSTPLGSLSPQYRGMGGVGGIGGVAGVSPRAHGDGAQVRAQTGVVDEQSLQWLEDRGGLWLPFSRLLRPTNPVGHDVSEGAYCGNEGGGEEGI